MNYFLRGLIPDPERRRVLLAIISILSIYGLTVGFFYPLISLNMELRGYSSSLIGLMGALLFLASIIVSPMIPFIMRFMDVRRWVFVSICSDIFFITLMIFFENIYIWFVSRFMMGVAGTVLFVVSETWINEVAEDHYRGRVMGLYTFVFSATLGISPLRGIFRSSSHWLSLEPGCCRFGGHAARPPTFRVVRRLTCSCSVYWHQRWLAQRH